MIWMLVHPGPGEANGGRISLVPTSPAQSLEKSYLILWLPGTSQTSSRPMFGPCRPLFWPNPPTQSLSHFAPNSVLSRLVCVGQRAVPAQLIRVRRPPLLDCSLEFSCSAPGLLYRHLTVNCGLYHHDCFLIPWLASVSDFKYIFIQWQL